MFLDKRYFYTHPNTHRVDKVAILERRKKPKGNL